MKTWDNVPFLVALMSEYLKAESAPFVGEPPHLVVREVDGFSVAANTSGADCVLPGGLFHGTTVPPFGYAVWHEEVNTAAFFGQEGSVYRSYGEVNEWIVAVALIKAISAKVVRKR